MKLFHYLTTACSLAIALLVVSNTASAQVPVPGIFQANVGNYSPVALGEDITLNACNSTFNVSGSSTTYSVCDIVETTGITYSWLLRDSVSGAVSFITNAAGLAGSNFILSTGGLGDAIQTAGVYELSLNVVGSNAPFNITTAGGNVVATYDFSIPPFTPNSSSTGFVVALTVNPAAVPEPEGLLLLLPALLYAGLRRRRKTVKA